MPLSRAKIISIPSLAPSSSGAGEVLNLFPRGEEKAFPPEWMWLAGLEPESTASLVKALRTERGGQIPAPGA